MNLEVIVNQTQQNGKMIMSYEQVEFIQKYEICLIFKNQCNSPYEII